MRTDAVSWYMMRFHGSTRHCQSNQKVERVNHINGYDTMGLSSKCYQQVCIITTF